MGQEVESETVPETPVRASTWVGGVVKSMRPHQWVKNAFVLAPLVFSLSITDTALLIRGIAAAALFSLLSSSVYLLNDIFDIEADRAHPIKRNRPIASGRVPLRVATTICATLATGTIATALIIDQRFALVCLLYFTLNVAYSKKLKHVAFVDVLIIASGFLLRILAGSFAIDVHVSTWLFLCTFLLALYLALGKRKYELRSSGQGVGKQRKVLEYYKASHLNVAMITVGVLTAGAYAAYTLAPHTQELFQLEWPKLALTIPFAMIGIARFFLITHSPHSFASPTEEMLKDFPFLVNLMAYALITFFIVYGM